jgi:hypothetical protein
MAAPWDVNVGFGFLPPPGNYNATTVVTNQATGAQVGVASRALAIVASTVGTKSAAWRRKFRRCCHWLIRQQLNYTASAGIFAGVGLQPVLLPAEVTILAGVYAQLYTADGYRPGGPLGPAPITPP